MFCIHDEKKIKFSRTFLYSEEIIFKVLKYAGNKHYLNISRGRLNMESGILSLLPPVIAIVLALITRNVIPALFAGVWLGATMMYDWNPFMGLYASFSDFIIPSVGDPWSATVLIYCGLFGVLIAFLQKTGGAQAIASAISRKVKTPRGAQGSTMLFGIIIFFEDYFNALTVGSVMRSVTDKMRVSREKLAYVVDSTSAPMCLLGPVSTWVVFVMGLIGA